MNIPRSAQKIIVKDYREDQNVFGTVVKYGPSYNSHTLGYVEKTGSPVADWQRKIQRREDASSPYFREGCEIIENGYPFISARSSARVSSNVNREYSTRSGIGLYTPAAPNMLLEDAVTRDRALHKLYAKIMKNNAEYNAMVPIGELKDLHGSARSMFELTSSFLNTVFNNRRVRNPLGFVGWLADAWLGWSFVAMPMSNDIAEIARVIDGKLNEPRKKVFTARQFKTFEESSTPYDFQVTSHYRAAIHRRSVSQLTYRFTCGYDYEIIAGNDYGLLSKLNLNNANALIPTLWELTPWSWLWDYFFTVGSYLEDTFMLNPKPYIYFNEIKIIKNTTYDIPGRPRISLENPFGRSNVTLHSWKTSSRGTRAFSYTRTPRTDPPSRIIRFKESDEIARNWGNKCLNLLSVLAKRHV